MGGKDGAEKIAAAPQVHVIPQNQTRSYWNGEMRVAEAVAVHPSSSETLQTRAFRAQRLTFQVAAGAQLLTNGVFGNWPAPSSDGSAASWAWRMPRTPSELLFPDSWRCCTLFSTSRK